MVWKLLPQVSTPASKWSEMRCNYQARAGSRRRPAACLGGISFKNLPVEAYPIGGKIGSEFLPHLDEGAIWARGTFLRPGPARRRVSA